MNNPKIHHDKKRSTKLTLEEIKEIRIKFSKNPNYKIFAKKYNVSQLTIRYWVDEKYRMEHIEKIKQTSKQKINDIIELEKKKQSMKKSYHYRKTIIGDKIKKYNKILGKKYRDLNHDKIKKISKKYYQENKKEIKRKSKLRYNTNSEKHQKWRDNNKQKIKEYNTKYYSNPEKRKKLLEYAKKRYQENKESILLKLKIKYLEKKGE
jgi:hypothetical protein